LSRSRGGVSRPSRLAVSRREARGLSLGVMGSMTRRRSACRRTRPPDRRAGRSVTCAGDPRDVVRGRTAWRPRPVREGCRARSGAAGAPSSVAKPDNRTCSSGLRGRRRRRVRPFESDDPRAEELKQRDDPDRPLVAHHEHGGDLALLHRGDDRDGERVCPDGDRGDGHDVDGSGGERLA
jgi:hypothetical protein